MRTKIATLTVLTAFLIMSCSKQELTEVFADYEYQCSDAYMEGDNAGYEVYFTATYQSTDMYEGVNPDNSTYAWDFGDGETSSTAAGSVWHTYTDPGTYTTMLAVTAPDGTYDSETLTVTVEGSACDITCYYDTGIKCTDYTATLFDNYSDFIANENKITGSVPKDGIARFNHLVSGKTYYVRVFADGLSGGFYDNISGSDNHFTATENEIVYPSFVLTYHP